MAYDVARARTVLFGGRRAGSSGDTWEWDGKAWSLRALTGPSARYRHTLAYDAARGATVLFGGWNGGYLGDTWEWDGTAWSFRASTGPSAREYSALAYDSARARTVLFGGYNGSNLGDTWEWDGAAWMQLASPGPAARSYHALAYDSARGRTVLFGGGVGDTWEWDGVSWTQRASTGPPARYLHALAYDAARQRTVLFGGLISGGGYLGDTSEWDGTAWTQFATTGPSARRGHALAYDSARGRTVLFGGVGNSGSQGDTWEWDGTAWTQLATTGPPKRYEHALAYDAARQRTVLFGGDDGFSRLGDTWEWDGAAWTQVIVTGPPARDGHSLAYDAARERTVLFGGYSGGYLGDTWEWDGTAWAQGASTGPSARFGHALAYDAVRQRTVLFGGSSVGASFGDTWEWDGTLWTQRASTGPLARYFHALAYDAARQRTLLFGGWDGSSLGHGDTWEYHRRGGPCATAADCELGVFCADGVCCDEASCGTCEACNLAADPGICSPVTNAEDPDSYTAPDTCGPTGVCAKQDGADCTTDDGCASGHCADNFCCTATCDAPCDVCAASLGASADGTCTPAPLSSTPSTSCGVYLCDGAGAACPATCSQDGMCVAGRYCAWNGKCEAQLAQGDACSESAGVDCLVAGCRVCETGACGDGYCCDAACDAPCDVCAMALGATANGACTPAAGASQGSPTCSPYLCDGTSAACGSACASDAECAVSAHCVLPGGACAMDADLGLGCGSDAECESGFCADGVCCASRCDGTCQACLASLKAAGPDGECGPAKDGLDPSEDCALEGADSCGQDGACDGVGRCRKYAFGSACGATTCEDFTGGAHSKRGGKSCDGFGTCADFGQQDCGLYACDGDVCRADCATSDDCIETARCDAASSLCVPRGTAADACTKDEECVSSFCVDGVCCATRCDGFCEACSAEKTGSGADGVCGNVALGADPDDECEADPARTCDRTGFCDGAGACELQPRGAACGTTACADGAFGNQSVQSGLACDGFGECAPGASVDCGDYRCNGDACGRACAEDGDCIATAYCEASESGGAGDGGGGSGGAGECRPKRPNGAACAREDGSECASGSCADGFCCNTACEGQCEACDVAEMTGEKKGKIIGRCQAIADEVPHGSDIGVRDACPMAGTECGGRCDGKTRAECTFADKATACGVGSCEGGRQGTEHASHCDGVGTCADDTPVRCQKFACGEGACREDCEVDAHCAIGFRCERDADAAAGDCVPIAETTCDGDHTLTGLDGSTTNCTPFRCEATGVCRAKCKSTADCVAGALCTSARKCEPVADGGVGPASSIGGCGCRIAGAPATAPASGALAVAWLFALLARLRRRFVGRVGQP